MTERYGLEYDPRPMKYERSIALLLHDGLRYTPRPLTDDQRKDLMWGLRMIALNQATDQRERDLFKSMLDHGWTTTAPYPAPRDPGKPEVL